MYFLPQDSVTFVWLMLLGVTGIVNITAFPGIFRSFDPSRAVLCMSNIPPRVYAFNDPSGFIRTKDFDNLAGVLLAVTGCEAMFAK